MMQIHEHYYDPPLGYQIAFVESFTVLVNRQAAGAQLPGGKFGNEFSKTEAETASNKNITHAIKTLKPLEVAKILTVECETAAEAAEAAAYLYGFSAGSEAGAAANAPGKVIAIKTSTLTTAETAMKP